MKIELKNVKYFAAGSEETSCFVATVYVDGVKAAEARNEGHGGCTFITPHTVAAKINEYAATLPAETVDMGNGETFQMEQTAETIIDELLTVHLLERDYKKAISKRMLYTKKDAPGIYQTNTLPADRLARLLDSTETHAKWGIDKILNKLPIADALAIYAKA